jgi:hypothetical protein
MSKLTLFAAVLLSVLAPSAYAMDMKCDDASMASMKSHIDGMKDAKMQKMATSEMDKADMAMKKHQMKSCMMHMDKAMKSMGTM